jgi:hypothetical protein
MRSAARLAHIALGPQSVVPVALLTLVAQRLNRR